VSSISIQCLPLPALVGFLLAAALYPAYIGFLRRRKMGQFIREEGPASHAGKASTPTMGGACFAFCSILTAGSCLVFSSQLSATALLVMIIALGCGAVGLVDDLSKLQKKTNAGVSGWLRLALEFGLGLALGGYLLLSGLAKIGNWSLAGLSPEWGVPAALTYVLFSGFLVAASTNAVNLHDGMDGLAAGTAALVLAAMSIILSQSGVSDLAVVSAAVCGGLLAFLLFNRYPAQVFMGDTGSLFLGGLMAALAMSGGIQLWFIPLALIYIVETLSVMAQVIYFKLTKPYPGREKLSPLRLIWLKLTKRLPGEGRRLLRMAPLHHHFEAVAAERQISEWQVVAWFWLAQAGVCAVVLVIYLLHIY
jgi:phospho-N-acetylmuramoyl-pentapeptide-transferase